MKRNLKIFWLLTVFSVKATTQSQLGALLFTLGKLLRFAMFFFFITILVKHTNVLQGYNVDQAILVLMTFELLNSFGGVFFREAYRFRSLVVSGGLDAIFVKPYNPLMRVLLGGVDSLDFIVFVLQLGIFTYLIQHAGIYSIAQLSIYVVLFCNAVLIVAALHIIALAIGIYTTAVDQTLWIIRDVAESGRFPVEIYIQPVRTFLTYIFPVGIMMTFPARGLFGVLTIQGVAVSFAISGVFLGGSLWLWQKALRHYQSWGG